MILNELIDICKNLNLSIFEEELLIYSPYLYFKISNILFYDKFLCIEFEAVLKNSFILRSSIRYLNEIFHNCLENMSCFDLKMYFIEKKITGFYYYVNA
jgi:hypothetical protein